MMLQGLKNSIALFYFSATFTGFFASAMSTTSPAGPVLVTGGSRGIGRATCLLLASKGYDVAVNFRSDRSSAESVRDAILKSKESDPENYSGRPFLVQADVSKEEDVSKMFDDIKAEFGKDPCGLVNNAGILVNGNDISELTSQDLTDVMAANVYGPFFCTREFVRRASTKRGGNGGSIVNVSSGSAYIGRPLVYAMSKGAIDSMSAGLAATLPSEGIRINSVAPGMTDTDMIGDYDTEMVMKNIPMGRVGKPEEIAESICFLLSDASSYTCGAKIRIAGGRP